MKEYLNPLSDIFIKYLFASKDESSRMILKSFINAVLTDKGFDPVTSVTVKNPFQQKQFLTDKYSILDILAENTTGKKFNIEVQTQYNKNFANRSLFYWSRVYSSQMEEGESFEKLRPVVSINLLDYQQFPQSPETHSCYVLIDKENRSQILTDHLILHYIQIPSSKDHSTSSPFERWLLFFKEEGKENETMKTLYGEDAILCAAHEKYKTFTQDQELFYAALSREKFIRDQISREENAREEGIEKGREEGIEKGFAIGEAQGLRKDKQIILKKLLLHKFQTSPNQLKLIDQCNDPDKLDQALEEILTAQMAEEVLEQLK